MQNRKVGILKAHQKVTFRAGEVALAKCAALEWGPAFGSQHPYQKSWCGHACLCAGMRGRPETERSPRFNGCLFPGLFSKRACRKEIPIIFPLICTYFKSWAIWTIFSWKYGIMSCMMAHSCDPSMGRLWQEESVFEDALGYT